MCLSSSYYFISICLFQQFNVASKPGLSILSYSQACGGQMPDIAVLEKSLPAPARTRMPNRRGQISSAQITLVHPSTAQGQGESLPAAHRWINSFSQEPRKCTSTGRQERFRAEQSVAQPEGEKQCPSRRLGRLLRQSAARRPAETALTSWAEPEVCSTCGFHRNRENMGRGYKHSWIPGVFFLLLGLVFP